MPGSGHNFSKLQKACGRSDVLYRDLTGSTRLFITVFTLSITTGLHRIFLFDTHRAVRQTIGPALGSQVDFLRNLELRGNPL